MLSSFLVIVTLIAYHLFGWWGIAGLVVLCLFFES